MKLLGTVALVACIGCQAADDHEDVLGTTESAIVSEAAPFVGSAAPVLPALAAHGRVAEASYNSTAPAAAHSAQFMDGVDLAAPTTEDAASTNDRRLLWVGALAGVANTRTLQPPAFAYHVRQAIIAADAYMSSLSAGVLTDAANVLSFIPNFSTPVPSDPVEDFASWTPPRARWLDSQWAFAPRPIFSPIAPERHYHYPTPVALSSIPERGARLYCAARELAKHQVRGSLGEKVLIPLSLLGQSIDIGVFEPFAYVDHPEKFVGDTIPAPNDGAQAFNIPLQLGVKITPLRPYLPSLKELRYPLVLTAADGEVVTDTARRPVFEDQVCFSFICIPIVRNDYSQRFKTTSHVDSALSVGQSVTAGGEFPLFWAGPLFVQLQIGFGASVGTTIPSDTPSGRKKVYNDRVLAMAAPPPGWPTDVRPATPPWSMAELPGPFLDGYWRLPQSYFNPDLGDQFYDVHAKTDAGDVVATVADVAPISPFRAAVLADDDHHVAGMSELMISGGLTGTIGLNASVAHIEIVAGGKVTGTVGLAHEIRDGVSANTGLLSTQPVVNLTITPTTYANATLNFKVTFSLHINLFLGSIDVNYDLINSTVPIADTSSAWSEEHTVRLGTDSTIGDATQQPDITSHTGRTTFPSFPVSVDACLADAAALPPVPTPCESTPASDQPKHIDTCLYTPISNQIDPCLHIPSADSSDPAVQCAAAKLTFLCHTVAQEQVFKGEFVLAHKLDLPAVDGAYSADLETMTTVGNACLRAVSPLPATKDELEAWWISQFRVASCDSTATLLDADLVKTHTNDVTAGTCPQSAP